MEHLLLGGVPAGDELDVVHEEDIRRPVFVPELLVLVLPDGLDQFIGEVVALDVGDTGMAVVLPCHMGDGVEQVGLAQARVPVDEQGVIVGGGLFRAAA